VGALNIGFAWGAELPTGAVNGAMACPLASEVGWDEVGA